MKAFKRWTALAISLTAVVALAVPSMASASRLESSKGVLAQVGSVLSVSGSAFGDNIHLNSAFGPVGCRGLALKEQLAKNDGTTVEAVQFGTGTDGSCDQSGTPVLVSNLQWTKFSIKPGSQTVSMSFTYTIQSKSPIVCHYTGTAMPFTYSPGSNVLVFTKAGLTSTGGCGSATMDATFELNIGSTPVILN